MKSLHCLALSCGIGLLAVGGALARVGGPPPGPPGGPPSPQQMMMPDLFHAAIRNDAGGVKGLLAKGADPNSRNFLGLTPLFLAAAAGSQQAVECLLANGAEIDAPSPYGTSLTFAAMARQTAMAKLLIAKGANPNPPRGDRMSVLMLAAGNGDVELAKLSLGKGGVVNAKSATDGTALSYAARSGQLETVKLLLAKGATVDAADTQRWTPLMHAAANGHSAVVKLLLERKADVNARDGQGRTPLLVTASYSGDFATMQALLAKDADVKAKDARGRTAASILARRGEEPVAALLRARGAAVPPAKPDLPSPAEAAMRGVKLIEFSTNTFQQRAKCGSCHHQGLGLMVTGLAQGRGYAIDRELAAATQQIAVGEFEHAGPMLQQAVQVPELMKMIPGAEMGEVTPMVAYSLNGVAAHGRPNSEALEATAVILGRQQFPDGHWQFGMPRGPMQTSFFAMTALAVRALQSYAPGEHAAEVNERMAKARQWLLKTPARTHQDRVFKLLGLKWAGASANDREPVSMAILAEQREDGGWAQDGKGRSDAYATGQALYALSVGSGLPAADGDFRRGVSYLVRTQDDDGSWYLAKTAMPANTYMDAGFPHGEAQYASFAATSWATMALLLSGEPGCADCERR